MTTSDAIALIRNPVLERQQPQSWCDLGCGRGTFTLALAELLAEGSTLTAVDLDGSALARVPDNHHGVSICKRLEDLRSTSLQLPTVDGMLMANVLHFVRDQQQLLARLLQWTDCLLFVEYERTLPSPWGLYPVDFNKLCKLLSGSGVSNVRELVTQRSRFGGKMCSALVTVGR